MTPEQTLDESPFVGIWDAPRETIRRIVSTDPRHRVNLLFFCAGAIGALDGFAQLSARAGLPVIALPALCAVVGLLAIPAGHAGAWYKRFVGRLFGGQATRAEVVAVAAWSTVPTVVGHGVLWLVRFALYGTEVLQLDHPTIDASPRLVQLSFALATLLFSVWSLCVSVVGFAEVNRFSVVRSIATSITAPLLVGLVAAGVALLVFRAYR